MGWAVQACEWRGLPCRVAKHCEKIRMHNPAYSSHQMPVHINSTHFFFKKKRWLIVSNFHASFLLVRLSFVGMHCEQGPTSVILFPAEYWIKLFSMQSFLSAGTEILAKSNNGEDKQLLLIDALTTKLTCTAAEPSTISLTLDSEDKQDTNS